MSATQLQRRHEREAYESRVSTHTLDIIELRQQVGCHNQDASVLPPRRFINRRAHLSMEKQLPFHSLQFLIQRADARYSRTSLITTAADLFRHLHFCHTLCNRSMQFSASFPDCKFVAAHLSEPFVSHRHVQR